MDLCLLGNGLMGLRSILERLVRGEIDLDTAEREIKLWGIERLEEVAKIDYSRELRKGLPEVILAEWKDKDVLSEIIEHALERSGRVIVSRVREDQLDIIKRFKEEAIVVKSPYSRVYVIRKSDAPSFEEPCGKVGILTAGTSDIPLGEEVRLIVEEAGCEVHKEYDVGIANLKRTLDAVKFLLEKDVDVIVTIAGMEGMLPSVVASLSDVLVIGLPSAVGYGLGGEGVSALYSMLQSCSPGMVVVNIGNSIGAAYAAIAVARRAALKR